MEVIPPWERRVVGWVVRGLFRGKLKGRARPVPAWLPHEAFELEGNTGARLAARWFPAANARGVVVMAHPYRRYAQDWFVMTGWVDLLHDHGYHVLTFDFAGYGQSRGGSVYLPEDVMAAATEARRRAPGVLLHFVGVSLGAFQVANALPYVRDVESVVLESPYPNFNAWYRRGPLHWAMNLFDVLVPRTRRRIQADANLARTDARRILVVAAAKDTVTPAALSRRVAQAGPAARVRYLELEEADHLDGFPTSHEYRRAVLDTLESAPALHVINGQPSSKRTLTSGRPLVALAR